MFLHESLEQKKYKKNYIGVIDAGTTTIKFILFDIDGNVIGETFQTIKQYYPKNAWVEEDPIEIWIAIENVIKKTIKKVNINVKDINAIGVSNQRESTLIWDKISGKPLSNLIVWQDRRTSKRCKELEKLGYNNLIKEKTGLMIDPYFSSTKLEWLLCEEKISNNSRKENICFGTVDSWVIFNLTGKHLTDVSNASRTMLFNINNIEWDNDLLEIFNVPGQILPKVLPSYGNAIFGYTKKDSVFREKIPICSVLGDQQAALFGQKCFKKGDIKSTFGTGSFIMINTGELKIESKNNLLSTIFYQSDNSKVYYALEAPIYNAGTVFQWLKEGINLINDYKEIEEIAEDCEYSNDLFFVPAFTGLGAPIWDPNARGLIIGLTRSTLKKDIIRAAIESLAYRTKDVLVALENDFKSKIEEIRIDGGVSQNKLFCKILSDLTGLRIKAFNFKEHTAIGAMYAAGLGLKYWDNVHQIKDERVYEDYYPEIEKGLREKLLKKWNKAVSRSKDWI